LKGPHQHEAAQPNVVPFSATLALLQKALPAPLGRKGGKNPATCSNARQRQSATVSVFGSWRHHQCECKISARIFRTTRCWVTGHLLRNCWNVFTTNSFDVLSTGGFGFVDFAGARFCAAALAA
jgi:hypothetical protein